MSRANQLSRILPAFVIVLLTVISCGKKDLAPAVVTHPVTPTDTLSQSTYTLDSTGTPTPGVILATPIVYTVSPLIDSPGLVMILDQSGHLLKQKVTTGYAFDFKRWTIEGDTRYTYQVNDPMALRLFGVYQNAGYTVIADSNLNELQRVNFVPFGDSTFQVGQSLDVHDFILLSDNHYIALAYDVKTVHNIPAYLKPAVKGNPVVAPVIEEVNNGVVVWSWDGSADTSFYNNSVEGNIFADSTVGQDYMHMNSMFVDPTDNNLICSMRNQDQIIKINRTTGAIVWRLGGKNSDFALDSTETFLRQHHATLTDNNQTLMLFDDGISPQRASSRIDEFQLDQVNKLVTGFKAFNIPEPFTQLMGSVQKVGNEYFIGGGTANYMLEVNYVTGQKVMEYKSNRTTYRAFKY